MPDKILTDSELERIDRGEDDYADESWKSCHFCGGTGENPVGECHKCCGVGEVHKESWPWP